LKKKPETERQKPKPDVPKKNRKKRKIKGGRKEGMTPVIRTRKKTHCF
jgi:hypothetical protein